MTNLKETYVSKFIDAICHGDSESREQWISLSFKIQLSPLTIHLFSYLLQAMAEEHYLEVKALKEEIIRNLDIIE